MTVIHIKKIATMFFIRTTWIETNMLGNDVSKHSTEIYNIHEVINMGIVNSMIWHTKNGVKLKVIKWYYE